MAGNKIGGMKARDTNIAKHGIGFYKMIGSKGGSKGSADGVVKGFAVNIELARKAGRKGGIISKRGKVTKDNLL